MTDQPSPLVLATVEGIARRLRDRRIIERGMLPPVKVLARDLRVSVTTVVAALARLREQGAVRPVRGKGVLIVTHEPPATESHPPVRMVRWKAVKAAMLRDLAAGHLPADRPLPSIKELQHRYGACFVIVKQALDALARDLDLRRYRKTYHLHSSPHRTTERIAVILPNLPAEARIESLQGLTYDFLRGLEREAGRSNIRIDLLSRSRMEFLRKRDDSLMGHCLWGPGSSGAGALAAELLDSGKPLAVVDESEDESLAMGEKPVRKLKTFLMGASVHGPRIVARHLAALGHRRIAFIAPWNAIFLADGAVWKLTRAKRLFDGLCAAFAAIDSQSEIVPFTFDNMGEAIDRTTAQAAEFRRQYKRFRDIPLLQTQVAELLEALSPDLRRAAHHFTARLVAHRRSSPENPQCEVFRLAAKRTDLTAWVTAYDMYGSHALRYLRRAGMQVPRDRSLVSFDDLSIAMAGRFTSYNFNADAAALGVIDHLLHPTGTRSLHATSVVHLEGFLVDRGTTGPVHTRTDANQSHSLPSSPHPAAV